MNIARPAGGENAWSKKKEFAGIARLYWNSAAAQMSDTKPHCEEPAEAV